MKRFAVLVLFLLLFVPSTALARGYTSFRIISATNSGGVDDADWGVKSFWAMDTTRVPTPSFKVRLYRRATATTRYSYPYSGRLIRVYYTTNAPIDGFWEHKVFEGKTNTKGEFGFPMKDPGKYRVVYGGNTYYRGVTISTFHRYIVAHEETYTVTPSEVGDNVRLNVSIDYRYNPYLKTGPVTTLADLYQYSPTIPWSRHIGIFTVQEDGDSNHDVVAGTRHMEFSALVTDDSVADYPENVVHPDMKFAYPYITIHDPDDQLD